MTVDLAARQQVTVPDVLAYLRSHGMQIPDGTTAAQAGTLTVTFRYLTGIDAPSTVVLARTTTPNTDAATGGAFGLFYTAVAKGGGARTSALVPGLAQDDGVRSNLAVVNTGRIGAADHARGAPLRRRHRRRRGLSAHSEALRRRLGPVVPRPRSRRGP